MDVSTPIITKITGTEDMALITLRNSPSRMEFITHVFQQIAAKGINVDMISQTAPLGERISLSFTVPEPELGKILELFKTLRAKNPEIQSVISGGNCKISLSGEGMRTVPGVAAGVFAAIADLDIDIRIITTSEVDISILLAQSDYQAAVEAFEQRFGIRAETAHSG